MPVCAKEVFLIMADELIDIFDENNQALGIQRWKSEAHKSGLWHRAVHIWIYNPKGEILLQLRSKDKDVFPDLWDLSVAGHISAGSTPEDSAVREIREEVGLAVKREELRFHRILKVKICPDSLQNNEFIYIFTLRYEGEMRGLKFQKEEIQKIGVFSTEFLKKDYPKHPERYTGEKERHTDGSDYWLEMIGLVEKQI